MSVTAEEVAQHVLKLLPPDGTPVLNRVMRVMLTRKLAKPIPAEIYFGACDQLVEKSLIGRSRGQNGHIFFTSKIEITSASAAPAPADRWSEARLMQPLNRYLEGPFKAGLGLSEEGICLVRDTSRMGPSLGRWARPDFIAVSAVRFNLVPGCQLDIHSFELKSETGATDLAVYEALAQTRFTHFGHLVWHLPAGSTAEIRLPDITSQCEEHGVGLIRMCDPEDTESSVILVDPVRKATLWSVVDAFLESRLNDKDQAELKRVIAGSRL